MDEMTAPELNAFLENLAKLIEASAQSVEDLERYAEEDKILIEGHPFTDRLNGYYRGRSEAYAFCAKWLSAYLEGR